MNRRVFEPRRKSAGNSEMKAFLIAGISLMVLSAVFFSVRAHALVVEYPSTQPDKKLLLVLTKSPGGLVLDRHGNIYYSDQGDGSAKSGRVFMIPKGRENPIAIFSGLDKPGDIELTPDEQGLIIAQDGGKIERKYFGLSVSIQSSSGEPIYGLTLYVTRKGQGTTKGYRLMENSFYIVPDLLVPELESRDVELTIEYTSGRTLHYPIQLGQDGAEALFGQTVKYFMLRN